MNEQKILAAVLQARSNYDRIVSYIDDKEITPDFKLLLNEVGEYYEIDPEAGSVDAEILMGRLDRRLPSAKAAERLKGVIKSLPEVSGANVAREVIELKLNSLGLEISQLFASGKNSSEIRPKIDEYVSLADQGDLGNEAVEEFSAPDIRNIISRRLDDANLIQIAPKALNDRIDGGARPGHHVLVFAPTEMGKTGFILNMEAHFLRQAKRVLHVGNEDPADDVILRLASRLTKWDKFKIKADAQAAYEICLEKGYGNYVFADLAPGTFPRIIRLVQKYKPDILVLDQLSNIDVKVSKNESKTGSLEAAAKLARAVAKRFNILVVSVVQAADSATGKVVLGRGDVHNSNVGIPGQTDLMVGLGADEAMEARGLREITLVKNKISGNHDHFTVRFNTTLSYLE